MLVLTQRKWAADTLTSMRRLPQSDRLEAVRARILSWLQSGMAPRQLAFTLALGFAIGCIPLLGVTTAICALAALALRLNMPAIQAANWAAMPLQAVLLIPFLRLGQRLFSSQAISFDPSQLVNRLQAAPWRVLAETGSLFGHALLVWGIAAGPALVLMTVLLTPLMHRVSRLAVAAAD